VGQAKIVKEYMSFLEAKNAPTIYIYIYIYFVLFFFGGGDRIYISP